jgi:GMP synthase (glutamine-hydrolysing) A subunit
MMNETADPAPAPAPPNAAQDGATREPEQIRVLIVDFGSQVTQLIARRVREAGVYSEIVPFDKAEAAIGAQRPRAIILSGGPASVHETGTPQAPQALFTAGVPVLGICYGEQAMVAALGGQVEGGHDREFGRAELQIIDETPLFEGVFKEGERAPVWMSHGDRVTRSTTRGGFMASSSTPRWCTPQRARSFSPISSTGSPDALATGPWRISATARSCASASR